MRINSARALSPLLVLAVSAGLAHSCVPRPAAPAVAAKPLVVVTLFPLYDFTRIIAGDRVELKMLLPPGVEPHDYEPSPLDLVEIDGAGLFLYTGPAMEPWAAGIAERAPASLIVVNASEGLVPAGQDLAGTDPHVWLDPVLAGAMVDQVLAGLVRLDPASGAAFRQNAEGLKAELAALDREYAAAAARFKSRTIIYAGHFAFGYLASRYQLKHMSPYQGFSPDAEPLPERLAQLIDALEASGQSTLFTEELTSPRVAEIIARQTGARVELLHGLHNLSPAEWQAGASYLGLMRSNLAKLVQALGQQ